LNLVESLSLAAPYLDKHGVSSPRLNAEILLCNLLGIERIELYTNFDRPLTDVEETAYKSLLMTRARRYPLQYMTGEVGFCGLTLAVREGVFIPRPETETLVRVAADSLADAGAGEGARPLEVLDLGTGCGNIAVSLATSFPGAVITATDIDPGALALCRENAGRFGVGRRVLVREGDLFAALDEGLDARYDLIVSNPPYIPEGCREGLEPEVRDHEPGPALFAGADGLDVVRRIVEGAPAYLKSGGWLVMEVGEDQAEGLVEDGLSDPWSLAAHYPDLGGRPRVVRARLGTLGVGAADMPPRDHR
jgi:release factor glutamine methyltransferase